MSIYLITGRSGSGKTTIAKELLRRGYNVLDGDKITGLARWEDSDSRTGRPINVDTDDYIDYSKVAWNWDVQVLNLALKDKKGLLFICGSASNQLDFHFLYDTVFVLTLDRSTHKRRIMERENYGNYGKHPKMLEELLNDQQTFVRAARVQGAIPVNADQSVEKSLIIFCDM